MNRAWASILVGAWVTIAHDARAEDEMFDYVVQAGDKCDTLAARFFGNAARIDLIHATNPQLGPPPHNLVAGSVLHLRRVAGTASMPDAKLSFVRNRVDAFTPGQHAGKPDEPLMRGHRVSTYDASNAEVRFASNATIQLGEKTLVVILGTTRGAVSKTAGDTTLVSGSMRSRLASLAGKPSNVGVSTQAGHKVDLGAGEAQVTVDPKQTTRVAVYKGQSAITAQRQTVTVPAGFGSKAEKEKPPTPPRPLPPSPRWITALPAIVFASAPVDVAAQFGPGSGPGPKPLKWHVQMARDDAFNDLIVDATVALDVTKVEARALAAGTYLARVSAIDDDQFEGAPGPSSIVIVAPMAIAAPPTGQDATIELPAGLFCGIDGAPLALTSGPLAFKRGPERKLKCAANADGEGASETTIPAQKIGPLALAAAVEPTAPGEARVTMTIVDPTKAPVTGSKVVAQGTGGVTISDVRAGTAAGTYVATARWPSGTASFKASVVVNGVDAAESAPIALPAAGPPIEAPTTSSSTPAETGPFDAALMAGLRVPSSDLGLGASLGVELVRRWQLDQLSFAFGMRASWEHHSFDGTAGCNAGPSPAPSICPTPYTFTLSDELFSFAFPITLRLGAPQRRFLPYAGLAPALLVDRSDTVIDHARAVSSVGATKSLFGLSGFLGLELRVTGAGRFFFEAGYRGTPELAGGAGPFTRSAWLFDVGYRGGL